MLDPEKAKAMARKTDFKTAWERRIAQYFPPPIHSLSGGLIQRFVL